VRHCSQKKTGQENMFLAKKATMPKRTALENKTKKGKIPKIRPKITTKKRTKELLSRIKANCPKTGISAIGSIIATTCYRIISASRGVDWLEKKPR